MSLTSHVDEWLFIMYNLGFINPNYNPDIHPTPEDEYRTAKIFSFWIGSARSTGEAHTNGVKIGQIISTRAQCKGIQLQDVAQTLTGVRDYYHGLVDGIDREVKKETDDEALGRKGGKTVEEKAERRRLERVGRLMMVLVTAAEGEIEKVLRGE